MRALVASVVASTLLIGVYLALGGASYAPAKVADPCAQRDWTEPDGLAEVGEQIVLSALDGAACKLGVSREEIVLAFENENTLKAFGRKHGVTEDELDDLARTGLEHAIDDAEEAGALNPTFARVIRRATAEIPAGLLIDLLERAPEFVFPDS
jgi:hypothetical protein